MSQAVCKYYATIYKGLKHPQVFTSQSETNSLRIPKGQLYRFHKIWAVQRPHVRHSGRCSEQLKLRAKHTTTLDRKKPNVISNRSLQIKVPRAEAATAGLIVTPLAPAQLCVRRQRVYAEDSTNFTRVSGAPGMIPQPAADKLKQTSCPEEIYFFLLCYIIRLGPNIIIIRWNFMKVAETFSP